MNKKARLTAYQINNEMKIGYIYGQFLKQKEKGTPPSQMKFDLSLKPSKIKL